MDENTLIGSMSENLILHLLIDDNQSREKEVSQVMGKPFPAVSYHATTSEISNTGKDIAMDDKVITKELGKVGVNSPERGAGRKETDQNQ